MKLSEITAGTILENASLQDTESLVESLDDILFEDVIVEYIANTEPEEKALQESKTVSQEDDLVNDFEDAQRNLKHLTDKGRTIVDELILLASQTDSPRAYEVLANTIGQLASINKDRIEIHNKRADIDKKRNGGQSPLSQTNVQNNVFLGSTADLQKFIGKQMYQDINEPQESEE